MSHNSSFLTEKLNGCLGIQVNALFDGNPLYGFLKKVDDQFFVERDGYGYPVYIEDITTLYMIHNGLLRIDLITEFSWEKIKKLN